MSTDPETARRLFIAVMADGHAREALIRYRKLWTWPAGCRFTASEDLHITLCFLGDITEAEEATLRTALAQVTFRPSTCRMERAQVWSSRVAVVLPEPSTKLTALHEKVMDAVDAVPLRVDRRRWRPHVTLARYVTGAVAPDEAVCVDWRVSCLSLMCSAEPGAGRRYRTIQAWPH